MDRVPEPELMTDRDQAEAYADADFEDAHSRMVRLFVEAFPDVVLQGHAVDLGCGPGDIACRFARAFPGLVVHGVDASPAMLEAGRRVLARYPDVAQRVSLLQGLLPDCSLPRAHYQAVISNSLLHHLEHPAVLWTSVERLSRPGTIVFVMDLLRPGNEEEVEGLVAAYAAGEPDVLRRDFANSLRAAYRVDEVREQLRATSLADLRVRAVTDRHFIVYGRVPHTS